MKRLLSLLLVLALVFVLAGCGLVDTMLGMAVAINQGNFAWAYSVGTGLQW